MIPHQQALFTALAVLLLNALAPPARAQFQDLVQHLPNDANTLVLIDAEAIHGSALAEKENWQGRHEHAFAAGLVILPPQATRFAMAAQMDVELMQPHWHAAVMESNYEPSMPKVAVRYGGNVDEIQGREAAVLPSNVYVVKFGKRLAGIMSPANRQMTARWIEDVYSSSNRKPLTGYLAQAERYVDELKTPIIMAMDLEHVLSPQFIRSRLDSFQCLKGQKVDLDELADTLASIQGATLGVTLRDRAFGAIKVDFGRDVSNLKEFAKPLLLEVLANRGAMVEEFKQWKTVVSGRQIRLEGWLYQSGMQRIFSVVDAPPALHAVEQATTEGQETNQDLIVQSSKQYFNSIEQLFGDLRGKRESTDFTTPGQVGMWYGKYARKIDALPVLNVDPDLVEFGAHVANQLRQAENAMKGVGARTAYRDTTAPNVDVYNYSYAYGGRAGPYGAAGGYGYRYNYDPRASARAEFQQRAQIQTQERIRGYTSANLTMEGLEAEMAEVRRRMTEKYKVEF